MTQWLSARYGSGVAIDWAAFKRHEWDEVAGVLSLCVAWAESEGLDDDDLPSWDWIALARKGQRGGDLAWLLRMLRPWRLRPRGRALSLRVALAAAHLGPRRMPRRDHQRAAAGAAHLLPSRAAHGRPADSPPRSARRRGP